MKEMSMIDRFNVKEMNATRIINTAYKLPIVFLLDTSGSMEYNNNIQRLNDGVNEFYKTILQDEEARQYVDVCVVNFGAGGAQIHSSFGDPTLHQEVNFKPGGSSPLCSGMLMGLTLLEDQIDLYNEKSMLSHPPIIITLTDGEPTTEDYNNGYPVMLTKDMNDYKVTKKRFDFYKDVLKLDAYTIFFGDDVEDRFFLEQFASHKDNVRKIDDINIQSFFQQLARSTSLLSKTAPTGESQFVMDYDIFEEINKKQPY